MENTKTPMKDKETKEWYKVEIRELIRKNLDKIHRKVGDSYGIDVSFLHKMISEYVDQEIEKARKEGYEKGRTQAEKEFAEWRRWR
jgi:hypothetical protein